MRYVTLLLLLGGLGLTSCLNEDIPQNLETSLFSANGGPLFTIVSETYEQNAPTRSDLTLTFDSVYDQLNQGQRDNITGIVVTGSRFGEMMLAVDDNVFFDPNIRIGEEACYEFAFATIASGSSKSTPLCVNP